jgi:hypothetical protein
MTIGPREMAALRAVVGPITVRDERVIRWARIGDQWSMAHHNLFRACRSTGNSFRKLADALDKAVPEDERPLDD